MGPVAEDAVDPAVDPTIAIPEVARLLNLWAIRNWRDTTLDTFIAWVEHTASLTPHPPSPDSAIPLLLCLNLARADAHGNVCADPALTSIDQAAPSSLDQLPRALALLAFDRLLGVPEFAIPLADALVFVRPSDEGLSASWGAVPDAERGNPAWLWLQQLGLAVHTGDDLYLDDALRHHVLCFPVTKRPLSAVELEVRLAAQKERAERAEEYVVALEKQRLIRLGADEYVDGVIRVSVDNVEAGYDILSYEVDGAHRHIEVKSSVGPRAFFMLTANEHRTARSSADSYWLAWVSFAERLPSGPCDVAWFRNPAAIIDAPASPWSVDIAASRVTLVGDDSPHRWEEYMK